MEILYLKIIITAEFTGEAQYKFKMGDEESVNLKKEQ